MKVLRCRAPVEIRRVAHTELARVDEIDRTERIERMHEQPGTELIERRGNWRASAWDRNGHGKHSVAAHRHALEHHADSGGTALGACSEGRLVGIGVVVHHLRPTIAQLAYLHVSEASRAAGVCATTSSCWPATAVTPRFVTATPSENTLRFYLDRGFELMAEPLPKLLQLERRTCT